MKKLQRIEKMFGEQYPLPGRPFKIVFDNEICPPEFKPIRVRFV